MRYPKTPDALFGELFTDVQLQNVFEDSKTFVDLNPSISPQIIVDRYRNERSKDGFDVRTFIDQHFEFPPEDDKTLKADPKRPVREYIDLVWRTLYSRSDTPHDGSSLIALPHPYIVPGGRFREVYYWDSYFSQLGLIASNQDDLVLSMVKNFAHLIDTLGFVPNGNRTYYTTRSQPPMFAMMVDLIASARADRALLVNFLPQMRAEYSFWMDGADTLDEGQAKRRVVRCANGVLNRYWDDATTPRPESYREDIALFAYEPPPSSALFQDIRAACESGWDFSARWLDDPHRLASACTRTVIPVDLNAILFSVESIIAKSAQLAGDAHTHEAFCHRAEARKALIQKMFFDPVRGAFVDLTWPELTPRPILSMATACPLFFEVATREQAERTALTLRRELLRPGGWVTTSIKTGQQWDAPNGWAPLQWFAYRGLMNYGFDHDAQEGARRWVNNNLSVYSATGALAEKYDVESIGTLASGGEYEVQTGFGWTNGVLLQLMNELGIE